MTPMLRIIGRTVAVGGLAAAGLLASGAEAHSSGWKGKVQAPAYQERIFPPWSHGANDPARHKGLAFTVPEVDDLADFHGDPQNAKLILYIGGNYYFAVAPLVAMFEKEHPGLRGRIYSETLPPGILLKQLQAGGTITVGNMTWTAPSDVYAAGKVKVQSLIRRGRLDGPADSYTSNDLAIMVPRGNPAHIRTLRDLGRTDVRLAMPNPAWEGVARQIQLALTRAGGRKLVQMVYHRKVFDGQTILTHIHHRQTPLYLMQGLVDAGVTWKSEAIFQEQIGHPISYVSIPARDNATAVYAAALVHGARHVRAAKDWLQFLQSPSAQAIFARYGFKPVAAKSAAHGAAASPIAFTPPPAGPFPRDALGKTAQLGENIFVHTQRYAKRYIGNGLNCENCHLDAGRKAGAAPLWAAYVAYPRYQKKYRRVVTFGQRLDGCFRFSMNGTAPPLTGQTIAALTTYAAWLARGAPVGGTLMGRGYPAIAPAPQAPSAARGARVFTINCAMCHGADGQGVRADGHDVFPPVWGPHSYNRGAGMYNSKIAAEFIKANMPFNKPGSLTVQQAWDVAVFINSQSRPPKPEHPHSFH